MKAEKNNWVAKYTSDEYDCQRDDLRIIDANDIDHPQGPFTVATVNGTGPHTHHGIDAARLMAAAPALLEALMLWDLSEPMPHGARRKVKAAIAAATTDHIPDQRTDVRDEETEAAGMAQLVTDMTAAVAAAAALKEARIQSLEDEGLTRSDAQGVVMAERKMF